LPEGVLSEAALGSLADAALVTPAGVILSPRRTRTDGFFVSVMVKT
jgi:hypothetical protein